MTRDKHFVLKHSCPPSEKKKERTNPIGSPQLTTCCFGECDILWEIIFMEAIILRMSSSNESHFVMLHYPWHPIKFPNVLSGPERLEIPLGNTILNTNLMSSASYNIILQQILEGTWLIKLRWLNSMTFMAFLPFLHFFRWFLIQALYHKIFQLKSNKTHITKFHNQTHLRRCNWSVSPKYF